jgi:hypothetical protein
MHDVTATILSSSVPTMVVLVGILLNRRNANRLDARLATVGMGLRGEMSALREEIRSSCTQFQNEMLAFRRR